MHTPGMHSGFQTPVGGPGGGPMGQKYPSMTSVHTMLSQGYLPPGHGFVPKPIKPDKPYGPTFISVMNRTWRGPGRKYLHYALFCFCMAILFLCASGLYLGHRNVSRMIVLRTEVFGAIFTIIFILMVALMFHFIWRARQESNKWRYYVRFRPEGLYHVVPFNPKYDPQDPTKLETGTYGKKALREIPKPGRKGKKKKRLREQQKSPMESLSEETDGPGPTYRPQPGPQYTRPGAADVDRRYRGPSQPDPGYDTIPHDRLDPLPPQSRGGPQYRPGGPQYQPPAPQQRVYLPRDSHMQPGRFGGGGEAGAYHGGGPKYGGQQVPFQFQHGGDGESSM